MHSQRTVICPRCNSSVAGFEKAWRCSGCHAVFVARDLSVSGGRYILHDLSRPDVYVQNHGRMHAAASLFVVGVAGAGIWALQQKQAAVPEWARDVGLLFLGGTIANIVFGLVDDALGDTVVTADDEGIGVTHWSNVRRRRMRVGKSNMVALWVIGSKDDDGVVSFTVMADLATLKSRLVVGGISNVGAAIFLAERLAARIGVAAYSRVAGAIG